MNLSVEEERFLNRIKRIRGMKIRTEAGPGRVWEIYENQNSIGVELDDSECGPFFFPLDKVISYNVFGPDNIDVVWMSED